MLKVPRDQTQDGTYGDAKEPFLEESNVKLELDT